VVAHRRHEGAGEIDAHLPDHALRAHPECPVRRLGELTGPRREPRVARATRDLIERVHPLRQIVEVLPVALPLEALVERLVRRTLRELLADPQAAAGRVKLAFVVGETADPAAAAIVGTVPAEQVVHAIHQRERALGLAQPEVVADREGVGPEVPIGRAISADSGAFREPRHQLSRLRRAVVRHGATIDIASEFGALRSCVGPLRPAMCGQP
jgi:hypothetical protein